MVETSSREPLPKGKAQDTVDLLVLTILISCFYVENIYKTSYFNEEVNGTEHSPSVGVPCINSQLVVVVHDKPGTKIIQPRTQHSLLSGEEGARQSRNICDRSYKNFFKP
jgi:hypothetical protein